MILSRCIPPARRHRLAGRFCRSTPPGPPRETSSQTILWARRIGVLAVCLAASPIALAQSRHATRVIAHQQGSGGSGAFDPTQALGAPTGGGIGSGSTAVHSLGIGGSLTLGFDPQTLIADGPGADFLVAENAFQSGPLGQTFLELAFVEVSSNGVDFARFPAHYFGPQRDPGPFGTLSIAVVDGLAGVTPVDAGSSALPTPDPLDVVEAGGDAFDLAVLATHVLVQQGRLDLQAITQVRLIDVRSGIDVDVRGVLLRDSGAGSADIDAVTVLHTPATTQARGPFVELVIPPDGRFALRLGDPDGLQDLDPSRLRASFQGLQVSPFAVLPSMQITQLDAQSVTLQWPIPLPFRIQAAFAIADQAGERSGARRVNR